MNLRSLLDRRIFLQEILCCVHSEITAVLFIKFLNRNQTFNADLYFLQLQCVRENLFRKRPELVNKRNVVLLLDNDFSKNQAGKILGLG